VTARLIASSGILFGFTSVGFFKADEVQETKEFAELPKHIQEHIKRPTVPLWEVCRLRAIPTALPADRIQMNAWSPPFHPGVDPKSPHLSITTFLHCPQSTGTIKLASADPKDPPLIDPNFLSHPFDRRMAVVATIRMLDFVEQSRLKDDLGEPVSVPASRSEEDILAFWREAGNTTSHPSCTAKMGRRDDPEACLDSDFQVHGLQNLRVVDLSALPFLPQCHPQSIAYLIGQCAAEKLTSEYGLDA
jgi:hypothetical protein